MTAETVEIPGYIAGTWDIDPVHSRCSGTGFPWHSTFGSLAEDGRTQQGSDLRPEQDSNLRPTA
jgi:hypothetical protein